ncbi:MAG: endonuclease/exonuclease/phosphatase family protein [Comamonas sp.]
MRPIAPPLPLDTLTVATCNLLNLARPQRQFYPNQEPFTAQQYERKILWLGDRFRALNADILAVQEVWDLSALQGAVKASGLHYPTVIAPGAEDGDGAPGAQGTPRVGLATRLKVLATQSFTDFPANLGVAVPGIGVHARFERPPLVATLELKRGQQVTVLVTHLKSKRPKFLQAENGEPLEDRDNPKIAALASLRSLMMRGVEATALRCLVIDLLRNTRMPVVVMGDFNDTPDSVTTQMVAATSEVAYDRAARDSALFNASDLLGAVALKKDVAYSHIHQGAPAVLDQILVSEEFDPASRHAIGDVRRVDYFNDHLHEGHDRTRSDHGFVRALLRLRSPRNGNGATEPASDAPQA